MTFTIDLTEADIEQLGHTLRDCHMIYRDGATNMPSPSVRELARASAARVERLIALVDNAKATA